MVTRRVSLFGFFVAAFVCAVLSGCAVGAESGDAFSSSEQTPDDPETRESPGRDDFGPPEGTLSFKGRSLIGELGGYCWTGVWKGKPFARCTESPGYPVTEEALILPAGSNLTFVYGGRKLDSLGATAHRIGLGARFERVAGVTVLVPTAARGIRLPTRRSENRARVVADLAAGEYAINLFARMPEGDAFYGFRVTIE